MKIWAVFLSIMLVLTAGFPPITAHAQFNHLDADARTVPWSTISRLALEGGIFPPACRPVTEAELARILTNIQNSSKPITDPDEISRLTLLLEQYQLGEKSITFHGPSCKKYPPHLRLSGRLVGGYSELGNPVAFEGGLSFAPGHNLFLEPCIEFAAGSFWAALNFRMGGRVAGGGIDFNRDQGNINPLTWPDWPMATGKYSVREARLKGGAWSGQLTRAIAGGQWGNWAISAGWDHHRTGPGLTGALLLDYEGRPFPAVTARRTRPFRWNGILTPLAPSQLLIRAGSLSQRTISWSDNHGLQNKEANPYFFQWLLGWDVTSWFRTSITHSVVATAREGTLWPDLLQINFPVIGTTWRELDSGPITDRLFAVQLEFRWNNAPWPILPASAGRLFWDYGGTDFLPSGPWGMFPEISIPASVAGFELLSPRWDLGFEYSELQHTKGLWYANGGYEEGYTQEHWLLAHPLAGSGESFLGLVRVRPADWKFQAEFQGKFSQWGMKSRTPGTGERLSFSLTFSTITVPVPWTLSTEWNREKADPMGNLNFPPPDSQVARDWWRIIFKIGI